MTIQHDADTGRTFVDEDGLGMLRAWLGDGDAAAARRLEQAGMLEGDNLYPALQPVAYALAEPFCHLVLDVAGPGGVVTHRGWAAPEVLVFFAHHHDETYEVLTAPPEFTPAGLARLTRLGVRPRLAAATHPLDVDALESLFAPDRDVRATGAVHLADTAPAERQAWAQRLRTELWRAWRLDVVWVGPDAQRTARQLTVLDTDVGMLEIGWSAGTGPNLRATTPTDIWGRFVSILPADAELLPPDAAGSRPVLS